MAIGLILGPVGLPFSRHGANVQGKGNEKSLEKQWIFESHLFSLMA